jgi:hypothetical protein
LPENSRSILSGARAFDLLALAYVALLAGVLFRGI